MNFKPEDDQVSSKPPTFPPFQPENTTSQTEDASPTNDDLPSPALLYDHQPVIPDNQIQETEDPPSNIDDHEHLASLTDDYLQAEDQSEDESAEEPEDEGPSGWEITKAVIREIIETVVLTLIIFFLIQSVIRNFRVDGHSMDPNLHHGEYLIVDKISYRFPLDWRPPQRGDVIVFEAPTQPGKDFVKRIIGLPGETIEIKQGQVFINGQPLDEPYGARKDRFSIGPRTIPEGEYFVMGDNRGNSNDSRNWGTLSFDKVVGRAWISYWPPTSWGSIPNDGPTSAATLFSLFDNAEASP